MNSYYLLFTLEFETSGSISGIDASKVYFYTHKADVSLSIVWDTQIEPHFFPFVNEEAISRSIQVIGKQRSHSHWI